MSLCSLNFDKMALWWKLLVGGGSQSYTLTTSSLRATPPFRGIGGEFFRQNEAGN